MLGLVALKIALDLLPRTDHPAAMRICRQTVSRPRFAVCWVVQDHSTMVEFDPRHLGSAMGHLITIRCLSVTSEVYPSSISQVYSTNLIYSNMPGSLDNSSVSILLVIIKVR